jgi:2-methylisocitrate lyase-like PEP mutase family enzyme
MTRIEKFRAAFDAKSDRPFLAPTTFNALSAQIAEAAGFKGTWMGGSAITNTLLGRADGGYINLSDMAYVLNHAVDTTENIGILADIDSGYGTFLNVIQAVQTVEKAGAVGAAVDDQLGHRTPYLGTTMAIPIDEAIGKVKAAVDARKDERFLIVARTDTTFSEGLDAAIERMNRYAEAGADCAFMTGVYAEDMMSRVQRETNVKHRMMSRYPDDMSLERVRALGFDLVALGQVDGLRASTYGMWRYYNDLHKRGVAAMQDFQRELKDTPFENWLEFSGLSALSKLEEQYTSGEEYEQRHRDNPAVAGAWPTAR